MTCAFMESLLFRSLVIVAVLAGNLREDPSRFLSGRQASVRFLSEGSQVTVNPLEGNDLYEFGRSGWI